MRNVWAGMLAGVMLFAPSVGQAGSFIDVDSTHPYYMAIEGLHDTGVLQGYAEGGVRFFKPLQKLNRAEALKILMVGAGIPPLRETAQRFPDVEYGAWYANHVNTAASLGIVKGFEDGQFHPSALVTRAEFVKMALESVNAPMEDEQVGEKWFTRYFALGSKFRAVENTQNPNEHLNRGEAAEILYRTLRVDENNWTEKYVFGGSGLASYYGPGFDGRTTASGEVYDQNDLTAAHRSLPFGTRLRVSTKDGNSVVVRINDRGPYHEDRVLDLSQKAFESLAPLSRGVLAVKFEVYSSVGDENPVVPEGVRGNLINEAKNALIPRGVAQKMANEGQALGEPLFRETVKRLSKDFFDNLTLRNTVAQKVVKGTVVELAGVADDWGHKKVLVFLSNVETEEQVHFRAVMSGRNFVVPVQFLEEGVYHLGIVFDGENKSRVGEIKVVPLPKRRAFAASGASFVTDVTVNVTPEDQKVKLEWENADPNTITKLVLGQGTQNMENLYIEDGQESVELGYQWFGRFATGKTLTLGIYQALSKDKTQAGQTTNWKRAGFQNFLLEEGFKDQEDGRVVVHDFPRFNRTLEPVTLRGRVLDAQITLPDHAYVTGPDGFVWEAPLQMKGDDFVVTLDPREYGTHVFEIVSDQGEVLFNRGIYIYEKEVLPVVSWGEIAVHGETRGTVLNWINSLRLNHNLGKVASSAELNSFAQKYAKQMVQYNFISHTDPQGNNLEARMKNAGFPVGEYGENLSFGTNIQVALNGLQNSGSHRQNLLTRKWNRVGIGIAKNDKGELYVVQVFGK